MKYKEKGPREGNNPGDPELKPTETTTMISNIDITADSAEMQAGNGLNSQLQGMYTQQAAVKPTVQNGFQYPAGAGTPPVKPVKPVQPAVPPTADIPADTSEDALSTMTDNANARRLERILDGNAKFVSEAQMYYRFTGTHWTKDTEAFVSGETSKLEGCIMREAHAIAGDSTAAVAEREALLKFARQSGDAKRCRDADSRLRFRPGMTVSLEKFDKNPWLLNCCNGTLDLRTATLREHRKSDLFTVCTDTVYNPEAQCERWIGFLHQIFEGNEDLVKYMQRAFGYALTGDISEQCMFVLHGAGANGKSTMLEIMRTMLGKLAKHAAMATFIDRDGGGVSEDKARLHGARLVTVSEVKKGAKLDEGFVKDATGGEPITARYLYQNSFEYLPEFKVFMAANHKPRITGTDEGIWRRIRLIPFERIFEEDERDLGLQAVLLNELPGILAWAVSGCTKWQEIGLSTPAIVNDATKEYRETSDVLGTFIEDRVQVSPGLSQDLNTLYESYKQWAKLGEYGIMQKNNFGSALTERGFKAKRGTGGVRIREGLQLMDHGKSLIG